MSAVHLDRVSFSYTSALDVFDDLTLHLGPGWTGVVGPNGSGKTTLLALISGDIGPAAGTVTVDPPGAKVIWCPQTVDRHTAEVQAFASSWEGEDAAWRARLGLRPDDLGRWTTLSPGERKRWQVGAALAARPDVLLVDEPTNHLDRETREALVEAMGGFGGAGLVVSHDRQVLDALCVRIVRVEGCGASVWNGDYSTASAAWEADAAERAVAADRMKQQARRLQKELADRRRTADEKRAAHRRSLRTAGPKDHDARGMLTKVRAEAGDGVSSREAGVLRRRAESVAQAAAEAAPSRAPGGKIAFEHQRPDKRRLLAHDGPLLIGSRVLARDATVVVERHTRVRISGPNGAGKSTLLARLVAGATIPPRRLLYLPQELDEAGRRAALERLLRLPRTDRGETLAIVGALGVDPDRLLASELPSPGEGRKLALADALARRAWCLVLDEPTNHLDLPSVERVEAALVEYPGAVVMVSHDDRLAASVTDEEWRLEGGSLRR